MKRSSALKYKAGLPVIVASAALGFGIYSNNSSSTHPSLYRVEAHSSSEGSTTSAHLNSHSNVEISMGEGIIKRYAEAYIKNASNAGVSAITDLVKKEGYDGALETIKAPWLLAYRSALISPDRIDLEKLTDEQVRAYSRINCSIPWESPKTRGALKESLQMRINIFREIIRDRQQGLTSQQAELLKQDADRVSSAIMDYIHNKYYGLADGVAAPSIKADVDSAKRSLEEIAGG